MNNFRRRRSISERVLEFVRDISTLTWTTAIIVAIATFGLVIVAVAWQDPDLPEIRIVTTSNGFSGWIVNGDQSVAFVNTVDPSEARSLNGRLGRPWESDPALVIVPPNAVVASAVWDFLQSVKIKKLVVAGIPEADPTWLSIERYCEEQQIELTYVERWSQLGLGNLTVSIVATNSDLGTAATIQVAKDAAQVAITLTKGPPATAADLVITNGDLPLLPADTVLSPVAMDDWPATQLTFNAQEVVTVRFSGRGIEITGAEIVVEEN